MGLLDKFNQVADYFQNPPSPAPKPKKKSNVIDPDGKDELDEGEMTPQKNIKKAIDNPYK